MDSGAANWLGTAECIVFEPLRPGVEPPARATSRSAGYDVRAHLACGTVRVWSAASAESAGIVPSRSAAGQMEIILQPGDRALIPTGFRARLPEGFEAQIRMRSSMAWKRGLTVPNSPGTVDADYPDEWFVLVLNSSQRSQTIAHGERIAQVVLNRFETADWTEGRVEASTERAGGLGSTGT